MFAASSVDSAIRDVLNADPASYANDQCSALTVSISLAVPLLKN